MEPMEPESRQHWTLRRGMSLGITLGIVILAGVVIYIATLTTRDPQATLYPRGLRSVLPAEGATAPRQGSIGVTMGPGWQPTIAINGTAIPDSQLDAGTRQLGEFFFSPGDGQVIDDIRPGQNCARVRAVNIVDDELDDIDLRWCWTAF